MPEKNNINKIEENDKNPSFPPIDSKQLLDDLLGNENPEELSNRRRPKEKAKENQIDISDLQSFSTFRNEIMNYAKSNMNSRMEYGEPNQINESLAQMLLTENDGVYSVMVYVRGLTSRSVIGQNIPVAKVTNGIIEFTKDFSEEAKKEIEPYLV